MVKELILHKIQSDILVNLLLNPTRRFSELNRKNISTDKFNFHLQKLVSEGFIGKDKSGKYVLTKEGKEFANRFDTDTKLIEKQAKVGVLICCTRVKNAKTEYLLQQRLKQPYYGFWGFITGKVKWGESIYETAEREFKEETGLYANFVLAGVKHKTDYDDSENLLEDKFFFVMRANNPGGKLKKAFEGGKNEWFDKENLFKVKDLFEDVGTTLKMASQKTIKFLEIKFVVKRY